MDIKNFLENVRTRQDFRHWLKLNCETETQCFICSKRGNPKDYEFCYIDAVEEAICFGWIDSVFKRDSSGRSLQKFTPRRKNSNWTELNKERARRQIRLGRMTEHGLKKLPDLDEPFKILPEILEILQGECLLWVNFKNQPPLYNRIKLDNIQKVRKNKELYSLRLEKFISYTKKGELYGQWDDYGRLML